MTCGSTHCSSADRRNTAGGRGAGIEDVGSAVAIATALAAVASQREWRATAAARLSNLLRTELEELGGTLTGGEARLPNFASCAFAGRRGEDMLLALDLSGV